MTRCTVALTLAVLTCGTTGPVSPIRATGQEPTLQPIPTVPTPAPVVYQVQSGRIAIWPVESLEPETATHEINCPWQTLPGHPAGRLTMIVEQGAVVKKGDLLATLSSDVVREMMDEAAVEIEKSHTAFMEASATTDFLLATQDNSLADLEWTWHVSRMESDSRKDGSALKVQDNELATTINGLESEIQMLSDAQDSPLRSELVRQKRDQLSELQLKRALLAPQEDLTTTQLDTARQRVTRALEQAKRTRQAQIATAQARRDAMERIERAWKTQREVFQKLADQCSLPAPADGVVMLARPWRCGDLVYPDQKLLTLIPAASSQGNRTETPGPLVPNSAIDDHTSPPSCLVVNAGKVERRFLELGKQAQEMSEVHGGLADGDVVVVNPRQWPWYVPHELSLPTGPSNEQFLESQVVNGLEKESVVITTVRDGAHVIEGEVICRLDSASLQGLLLQETVAVEESHADLRRAQCDYELALTEGQTACADAESQVALAEAELNAYGTHDGPGLFQARKQYLEQRVLSLRQEENEATVQRDLAETTYAQATSNREEAKRALAHAQQQLLGANSRLASARFALTQLDRYAYSRETLTRKANIQSAKRKLHDQKQANARELAIRKSERASLELTRAIHTRQLEYLREQLARATIVAPCAGVVWFDERVVVGEVAAPGQVLAVIDSGPEEGRSVALVIPTSAVLRLNGVPHCQVWKDGLVVLQPVVIGRQTLRWIEVVEGLSPATLVARDPTNLQDQCGQMGFKP